MLRYCYLLTLYIYLVDPLSVILCDLALPHDSAQVAYILGELVHIVSVNLDLCDQVKLLFLSLLGLVDLDEVARRQLRGVRQT